MTEPTVDSAARRPSRSASTAPSLFAPSAASELELAADVGDLGIGEGTDEHAQRVGRPGRVRVGEGDELGVGLADGAVLGRHLAAARVPDHAGAGPLGDRLGLVGRRVRGDDDLEQVARVVEGEKVLRSAARSRAPRCGRRRSRRRTASSRRRRPGGGRRGRAARRPADRRRASRRARRARPRRRPPLRARQGWCVPDAGTSAAR